MCLISHGFVPAASLEDSGRSWTKVTANRAPVLTLWAAVVVERLGYP